MPTEAPANPPSQCCHPSPVCIALAVDGLQPTADPMEDEEDPLLWHEGPFLSQCFHLSPEGPTLANTSSWSPLLLLAWWGSQESPPHLHIGQEKPGFVLGALLHHAVGHQAQDVGVVE